MVRHHYDKQTGVLTLEDGSEYQCSCKVRNLENGKRRRDEVIRTIPGEQPYSPQTFPEGVWRITGVEGRKGGNFDRGVYGDVKIRTNASQMVNVWTLDTDGDYYRQTDKQVEDEGYLLHESPRSTTTWGCIRLPDKKGIEIATKMAVGDELEVM